MMCFPTLHGNEIEIEKSKRRKEDKQSIIAALFCHSEPFCPRVVNAPVLARVVFRVHQADVADKLNNLAFHVHDILIVQYTIGRAQTEIVAADPPPERWRDLRTTERLLSSTEAEKALSSARATLRCKRSPTEDKKSVAHCIRSY